jgi:hypothetical protein
MYCLQVIIQVDLYEPLRQNPKRKTGQGWYAKLSDEKRAAYLEK